MFITPDDLTPFAEIEPSKAEAMIADAEAMALVAAPCIERLLDEPKLAAVKAILRGAIIRWNDAGSGALQQQSAGPFAMTVDTRAARRDLFWPSEIKDLQSLCADGSAGAYTVDMLGCAAPVHVPWCNLHFGANYCSCGSDLTRYEYPIYELG